MSLFEKNDLTNESTIKTSYIKSSYCNGGACVEVARLENGEISLRDSKDLTKEALSFTPDEWSAFLKGVKAGEFDT